MVTQQMARMEDYLKRIALLCDGRSAVKVTEAASIWQHARGKIREKINGMASHNSNQTKMNYLAKITDLSAPLYDLIFRLFWFTRGREAKFRQKVTGVIDLTGEESVLDVGCGTGALTSMLAAKMNGTGSIFGIDLSARMIKIAQKKASQNGKRVEYKIASSMALPFDDETFDVVVTSLAYHQLMSMAEKTRTLGEISRVLKPEGRYIAVEFSKFTMANLFVVHNSLIRGIDLFSSRLLEENRFRVCGELTISKGIMIISARKEVIDAN